MKRNDMIAKVRALFAMTVANGCTEAEALAALAMANRLMTAYEVSAADLAEAVAEGVLSTKGAAVDANRVASRLCRAIGQFTDTRGYTDHDKKIVFMGARADVELAHYLIETLQSFVQDELFQHLLEEVVVKPGMSMDEYALSFVTGCVARIVERLRALCDERDAARGSNSTALVVSKAGMIKDFMKRNRIVLQGTASRTSQGTGYAAGQAAGDRASFGRPVAAGGPLRLK